jgi:hypothetical protein
MLPERRYSRFAAPSDRAKIVLTAPFGNLKERTFDDIGLAR